MWCDAKNGLALRNRRAIRRSIMDSYVTRVWRRCVPPPHPASHPSVEKGAGLMADTDGPGRLLRLRRLILTCGQLLHVVEIHGVSPPSLSETVGIRVSRLVSRGAF